jgi:hypothetical protein
VDTTRPSIIGRVRAITFGPHRAGDSTGANRFPLATRQAPVPQNDEQRSDAVNEAEVEPLQDESLEEVAGGMCSWAYCSAQV